MKSKRSNYAEAFRSLTALLAIGLGMTLLFDAVGFELDEDYYRESKQRLERFMKQITLFDISELER